MAISPEYTQPFMGRCSFIVGADRQFAIYNEGTESVAYIDKVKMITYKKV